MSEESNLDKCESGRQSCVMPGPGATVRAKNVKSGRQSCGVNFAKQSLPHGGADMAAKCPKICIKTFGCQMNVRDSEVISGLMKTAEWKLVDKPEDADVVIINTCSVRQHAEDRVWQSIGNYVKTCLKKTGRKPIIGLVGCMAQNYKQEAFRHSEHVDFVVGPSDIAKIPKVIEDLISDHGLLERKIWETSSTARPEEIYHAGHYEDKEHAYVVISEGCSNFCSYCLVPYVRGPLHNRADKDILKEIKEAADKGITSVTLLGQNVNAYKDRNADFVQLLRMVDKIEGIREFDFMTSHPRDTSEVLFRAIADCKKLKKQLHLPLQSGSDRILELMGRGYTRKYYLDLCQKYRKIVSGGKLGTDIIVGFPSELETDFRDTYDLMNDVGFDAAYIFKYSARPQAKAADMPDDVTPATKEKRHQLILELQRKISQKKKCA